MDVIFAFVCLILANHAGDGGAEETIRSRYMIFGGVTQAAIVPTLVLCAVAQVTRRAT